MIGYILESVLILWKAIDLRYKKEDLGNSLFKKYTEENSCINISLFLPFSRIVRKLERPKNS